MNGILGGVRVLDLSRGIAGPMTGMLLADYGADVVRVEPPGGDGFGDRPGSVVWNRGKRRVEMDLKDAVARVELLDLAARADVLLESYRPGVTTRLGIDFETINKINGRLVYASITGYGRDTPDAQRPGIEWLVTARAGLQWDQRGYYGTRMDHIMGTDLTASDFPVPPGAEQTGCREGPIFLAVPWASIGAMLLAVTGISSGLYVRERTGRGQLFETSLVQASIMANAMGWQRVARMHPSYRLWYFDRRAPKGIFQAGDGTWLHQFAPIDHDFIRANAADADGSPSVDTVGGRHTAGGAGDYEANVRFQALAHVETARAIATRPLGEWIRTFWAAGRAAQPILSPEEGLLDEPLEREGVIVELDDPECGRIRQVGHAYAFEKVANPPIRPRGATVEAPSDVIGTWAVRDEPVDGHDGDRPLPAAPLTGLLVLDFGLAIAGPYGAQILADLGATVIKITTLDFDLTDAIYVGSSHGKLALALDLKHPRGLDVARRLIEKADVIHHNMRTGVAERLSIGYEQARAINQRVIYCHTRGFERDGPRTALPGNDQMGQALSGSAYDAGGTHHGTPPIWQMLGFGDTGNGILSANAVIQALIHRERTGEGQFVHTSILNTSLLFTSYTFARPDGSGPPRPRIDAGQFGFSAVQRLYETVTGWVCIFVRDDTEWAGLCRALDAPRLATDGRFLDASRRAANDAELAAELAAILASRPAEHWSAAMDRVGVPCEIASSTFARELFDDPEMHRRGWVIANPHEELETVEQVGMSFSFSATPAMNLAGAPVTGQHSRTILADLGYTPDEIDALVADGVVADRSRVTVP